MRAVSRTENVAFNTVASLLTRAGEACAALHDERVRGIEPNRIECDEIWSFVYAKKKNVEEALSAPEGAGDAWTFTALDSKTKLIVSYLVGHRDRETTRAFVHDLRSRVSGRIMLVSDAMESYEPAVLAVFGERNIDYAQLVKQDGETISRRVVEGYVPKRSISTSFVERHNLTIRMGNRRFTRLTNGFSKRVEKHVAMLHLFFAHYNFCRLHQSLRVTPAMQAGIETTLRDCEWLVSLIDARTPKPKRPEHYKKRAGNSI